MEKNTKKERNKEEGIYEYYNKEEDVRYAHLSLASLAPFLILPLPLLHTISVLYTKVIHSSFGVSGEVCILQVVQFTCHLLFDVVCCIMLLFFLGVLMQCCCVVA